MIYKKCKNLKINGYYFVHFSWRQSRYYHFLCTSLLSIIKIVFFLIFNIGNFKRLPGIIDPCYMQQLALLWALITKIGSVLCGSIAYDLSTP